MIKRATDVITTMLSPLSVIVVVVAFAATGCGRAALPANVGVPTARTCPESEAPLYFPEGVLPYADFEGSDLRTRQANSAFLVRIDEPSLWCGDLAADEENRFTWHRTWDDPLTIRVSRTENRYSQYVVIVEGPGGFTRGPVKDRSTRDLTREEWRQITTAIDRLQFWSMTTEVDDLLGNDGASWVIEGRRDGRYQWVARWSGTDGVEDAGRQFLDVAGLSNSVGSIY